MKSIQNIFQKSISQSENLDATIKDLCFELSYKKLSSLDDKKQIQSKTEKLFAMFCEALRCENLYDSSHVLAVIDGLLRAVNFEKESILYDKIRQRDKIEYQIISQTKKMKENVGFVYESIENLSSKDKISQNALKDAKLNGVYELGILKEVVEEGLLTTIEKGIDIEEMAVSMIKNFVFRAIDSGDFTKERIINIVRSVLDASVDIANSDLLHSGEIIRGSVFGSYQGISKAVEIFKNNIQFAPEDSQVISKYDLERAKAQLHLIDEMFIDLLKEYAKNGKLKSSKIINEILKKDLDNPLSRMKRLSFEARDVINQRLEEIKQDASEKFEQIKESASDFEKKASQKIEEIKSNPKTIEAQKLGERAWEVAKEFVNNAKNAMGKK